jgi:hypothetical protein
VVPNSIILSARAKAANFQRTASKRKGRAGDGAALQVGPGEDPSPEYDLDKHVEGLGFFDLDQTLVIGVSQNLANETDGSRASRYFHQPAAKPPVGQPAPAGAPYFLLTWNGRCLRDVLSNTKGECGSSIWR